VWYVVLVILGGIWLGCAYIFFKRAKSSVKRPGNVAKKRGKKATKELQSAESWQYSRNWRRAALTGLIIIPLLAASGIGYQHYILTQPPREFLVLVADFKGPEPENYRVTETVLNRLREVLKPYDHAKVESLGRAITEAEGSSVARAEGEKRKASIVIWGWYGVTAQVVPLSINFEILCPLRCSPTLSGEVQGEVQKIAVAELESFTLQSQLSDEMALLSLFVVGLVEYSVENWDRAIASFTDALSQVGERKSALY
jgi:hypothetical protein